MSGGEGPLPFPVSSSAAEEVVTVPIGIYN